MTRNRNRQPIPAQPIPGAATAAGRAAARERRRKEPGLARYHDAKFLREPLPGDPLEHLEAMRQSYIAAIEECARQAPEYADRAAILLKLLKFTSLGRIRVDVTGQLGRLAPEADLRALSDEQLAAIMRGDVLPALPEPSEPEANSPSHMPLKPRG